MSVLRAVLVCTAAVVVVAPLAIAKGKPPAQGQGCKPNATVILKGKLTSDPAEGATSFAMNVTGTNAHGKELKALEIVVSVDTKTKIRRQGAKTVESLAMNDRVNVQLRRCKADLPLTTATVDDAPAARVTAQAAKT